MLLRGLEQRIAAQIAAWRAIGQDGQADWLRAHMLALLGQYLKGGK